MSEDTIKTDNAKKMNVVVSEVEKSAIIATIGGWRRRIYFDMSEKDKEEIFKNKEKYMGKQVEIEYDGDLKEPMKVKPKKLKKL